MPKLKEELKNYINHIHPIEENIMYDFLDCWEYKPAKKREILTDIGSRERYLHFITKGVQKAYYLSKGNQYNIAFSYPYAFTCVPESFLTQQPSLYCWQCITDSEFLRISYKQFFSFVEHYPEFETLLRKKLIGTLNGLNNRYYRLLTLTMEERFRDLMNNSPQLINLIPQKEIANYLKIDPTNFSKLINSIKL